MSKTANLDAASSSNSEAGDRGPKPNTDESRTSGKNEHEASFAASADALSEIAQAKVRNWIHIAVVILAATATRFDPDIDPGEVIATATDLSTAYNAGLNGVLGSVPGVRIIDIFSEIQRLVRHPEEFEDHGIVNSEDACVTPEQPPYVCKQPDGYVFWDGVHPTKVAHGIIADVVAETLAE